VILPLDTRDWPEEARDELEERIAIVCILGKEPIARAETKAIRMVRERWRGRADGTR
jgi:hypothetical protein